MNKLLLLFVLIIVFSTGCSRDVRPVEISQSRSLNCPEPPRTTPFKMLDVEPIAIFDEYGIGWVGIKPQQYSNLAINIDNMAGYMKEQKIQTEHYKKCIAKFNEKRDANDDKAQPRSDK